MGDMDALRRLIAENEDWLISQVLSYARKLQFTKYTSTLEEAWRIAIRGLSASLLEALRQHRTTPELDPDADYTRDPAASFGILEAQRHRARGVTLAMFLGLMKYCEQSYLDLVETAGFGRQYEEESKLFIRRVFDHIELGFCTEWSEKPGAGLLRELQSANRAMTNEKNRYLTIFESTANPVILVDPTSRIRNMNHAAAELVRGITVPGSTYYGGVQKGARLPFLTKELKQFAASGATTLSFEKDLDTKSGVRRFEVTLKGMLDVSRKFGGVTVILNDVTARRAAEEERERNEERLASILETLGDGIIFVGRDKRITFANAAAEAILGLPRKEILGRAYGELGWKKRSKEGSQYILPFAQVLRTGKPVYDRDLALRHSEKGTVILSVNASPLFDASGRTVGVIASMRDVTQQKWIEDEFHWELSVNAAVATLSGALIISGVSLEHIAGIVLEQAKGLTGSEHGFVSSVDPETGNNISHTLTEMLKGECVVSGKARKISFSRRADGTYPALWGHSLNSRKGFYTNSPPKHRASRGVPRGHIGIRNFLSVPAMIGDRVVGQIALANSVHGFKEKDLVAVQRLADLYGLFIERKRAEEGISEAYDKLEERVEARTRELLLLTERLRKEIGTRQLAEEALRGSSELLEKIFSSTHVMIAYMDRDFNFIRVNEAYAKTDGRAPDFFIGRNHFDLYASEENEWIFRGVVETGAPYFVFDKPFVYPHNPERGVTYWDWSLQPIKGLDGKVEGIVLSLIDRTERRQTYERLREKEEERMRLAAAVEQSADGVIIFDRIGRIEYVNPAFERMSGYGRHQLTGANPDFLKRGPVDDDLYRTIQKTLGEGRIWGGRLESRRKDGSPYEIETTLSPIRDESGTVLNFVFVGRDVTEQARLERQLQQGRKMEAIGKLAGGIAHDFNNIIAGIIGFTEMALDATPEETEAGRMLQLALKGAYRGRELVRQILTFSRTGEQESLPLWIAESVREVMGIIRASLPSTIQIRENIQAESSVVLGSRSQVHQVLLNLCTNAAQAMGASGGLLYVDLEDTEVLAGDPLVHPDLKRGGYVKLTVADTGCGIEAENLDRIFEPFFTTKAVGEGSGLGLSVVHGIVKRHKGTITVSSEPGKGTSFTVFFPKFRFESRGEKEDIEKIRGGDERILFVDYERTLAEMNSERLSRLGYRVTMESDSRKALQLFRRDPQAFDLVITDYTMPKITGADLAKKIRKVRADIPVMVCSGLDETVPVENFQGAGIAAFRFKTLDRQELAEVVRKVLDGKRR
jgi:PAS domain S-box-containing protein